MPRVTRNFWIEANIDGRSSTLEGGPRGRRGEFSLVVYIRDNGSVLRAVTVSGQAMSDGTLAVHASAASDVTNDSQTGHVEPGTAGFSVTTQAGYKPERPPAQRRTSSAAYTRELLRTPDPENGIGVHRAAAAEASTALTGNECRYLASDVATREACFCSSCRLVLEAEQEREQAALNEALSTTGLDPFGRPYA
jgi:hypothetical protein